MKTGLNQNGFSLIQTIIVTGSITVIATGLMALSGYMQDGIQDLTNKTTVSMLTSSISSRLQFDPMSLRDSGFDRSLNPDLYECLTGLSADGSGRGGPRYHCKAYDFANQVRPFVGFSIKDRVTGSLLTGPPSAPVKYDSLGGPCSSGGTCPIEVSTEFLPECGALFGKMEATEVFPAELIASSRCARPMAILVKTKIRRRSVAGIWSEQVKMDRVPANLWNSTRCAKGQLAIGINGDGTANCGDRVFEHLGTSSLSDRSVGYMIGPGTTNFGEMGAAPTDVFVAQAVAGPLDPDQPAQPAVRSKIYMTQFTTGWFEPSQARRTQGPRVGIIRLSEEHHYEWSQFPLSNYPQFVGMNPMVVKPALLNASEAMMAPSQTTTPNPRIVNFAVELGADFTPIPGGPAGQFLGYELGSAQVASAVVGRACPTARSDFGGSRKVVLVKYNASGSPVWTALPFYDATARTASDLPAFVHSQSGSELLGAVRLGDQDFQGTARPNTHQQLALARINESDGQLSMWAYFGPTNVTGRREYFHTDHLHVVSAPGNTFYLAGTVTGGILPGSSNAGIFFVSRIDRNLNVLWTRQFGPTQLGCVTVGTSEVLQHSGPLSTDGMSSGAVLVSAVGLQRGVNQVFTDIFVLTRFGATDFIASDTFSVRRVDQDGNLGMSNSNLASSINFRVPGRLMHSSANILSLLNVDGRLIVSGTTVQSETTGVAGGDVDLPRGRVLVQLGTTQPWPTAYAQVQTELHSNLYWLRTGEIANLYRNPLTGKLQSIVTPVSRTSAATAGAIAPQNTGFISFAWPDLN